MGRRSFKRAANYVRNVICIYYHIVRVIWCVKIVVSCVLYESGCININAHLEKVCGPDVAAAKIMYVVINFVLLNAYDGCY